MTVPPKKRLERLSGEVVFFAVAWAAKAQRSTSRLSPIKLLLFLPLFLSVCTSPEVNGVAQNNASTPTPQRTPDEILSREMDRVAKLAGLPRLSAVRLAQSDIEIRIWYGFGLVPLEGFAMKRTNGHWSALHLKADHYSTRYTKRVARIQLTTPTSGWEHCWERLRDADVLTLPSGTEGPDPDAEGFYVETRKSSAYRNYQYISPEYSESPQAKRLDTRFGVKGMSFVALTTLEFCDGELVIHPRSVYWYRFLLSRLIGSRLPLRILVVLSVFNLVGISAVGFMLLMPIHSEAQVYATAGVAAVLIIVLLCILPSTIFFWVVRFMKKREIRESILW
jgi:hypothetical protein